MMRNKWAVGMLAGILTFSLIPMPAAAEETAGVDYGTPGEDYVEGEVIVCIKGGEEMLNPTDNSRSGRSRRTKYQADTLMELGGGEIAAFSAARGAGENKELMLVTGENTENMLADLEDNPYVEYAEPNYIMVPYGDIPTDPAYGYQWALDNNVNQDEAVPAIDVNAKTAWADGVGQPSDTSDKPVVAVVDTGVDYNHPDLKGIMWDDGENYPELTELGGGMYGVNYSNNGNDTTDPMDREIGHGTHCSSIIASQWDNEEGTAGINGNAEIMAVKFLGGNGTLADVILCYNYLLAAKKAGVNLVAANNSWGPSHYNGLELKSVSTAVNEAGKAGIVSCFAAGNSDTDNDRNTGSNATGPYAIFVGAMDSQGYATYFSCYGSQTVDVFAPGAQILAATSTNNELPMNQHEMPAQYLPWIQPADENYFYEDFEDEDDQTVITLTDGDGNPIEGVSQIPSRGYNSSRGLGVSLDDIEEGDPFALEISFPAGNLPEIDTANSVYLAFAGAFDNAMYGQSMMIQQKVDDQWIDMSSTQKIDNVLRPMYLRMTDHNWNISSKELLDKEFLGASGKEGTVQFRISGIMTNKSDNAFFHLDNIGLGKKASNYYYSDGTSMAAPMVTGTAALLAEKYGAANGTEAAAVCARIKGGVNRENADEHGLADKSVSGGFLDVGAAFDDTQVVPVLTGVEQSDSTAELTGYFFGTDTGSVTVDGVPVTEINSWTEQTITIRLPEGSAGNKDIAVTTADGKYGHDYFDIGSTAKGFTDLNAPELDYGDIFGVPLSSSDGIPIDIAATEDSIAYIGVLEETDISYIELYDIPSNTWAKVNMPPDAVDAGFVAGGKSRLYLTYTKLQDGQNIVCLGTYDTANKSWTSVTLPDDVNETESLIVYNDQLLLVGGERVDENTGITKARREVDILDPKTGKLTGSLPDMPEGRSEGNVSASGDMLIVAQGYDYVTNDEGVSEKKEYNNLLVYDGNSWSESKVDFFGGMDGVFDSEQTLNYAMSAVDGGMLVTGPVKGLGTEGMVDTWKYDAAADSWSPMEDRLYHGTKTVLNIGAAAGDKFYVLSRTNDLRLIFRSTEVSYTGPTKNPGEENEPVVDPPVVDPPVVNPPAVNPPVVDPPVVTPPVTEPIVTPPVTTPDVLRAKEVNKSHSAAKVATGDKTAVAKVVLIMVLAVLAGTGAVIKRRKYRR